MDFLSNPGDQTKTHGNDGTKKVVHHFNWHLNVQLSGETVTATAYRQTETLTICMSQACSGQVHLPDH
jgi:hypothetical protein